MKSQRSLEKPTKKESSDGKWLILPRQRLLALDVGLPIFVIEAPSGFGKTTLADMWLNRYRRAGRCNWVYLDKSCGDPVIFLNKVLDAVGVEGPSNHEAGLDSSSGISERFESLCMHLSELDTKCFLVFDDAHAIANSNALMYLERLLTLASSTLSICLTTQPVNIELGLSRLAGLGMVTWVQASDLKMTSDEVRELSLLRGRGLSESQLDSLYRTTEGWPALTQIALVASVDFNADMFARDVPGSAPLRDFIYQKFIQTLSDDDKEVLWTLSSIGAAPLELLVALNPPEAKVDAALTRFRALGLVQNRDMEDGSNVFLHALIREVSSKFLANDAARTKNELLREAAEWTWMNGPNWRAISLALEAGPELVSLSREWIQQLGFNFIFKTGQHQTILDLIERWEHLSKKNDPDIDSIAAWGLIFQRQFVLAEQRLARILSAAEPKLHETLHLQRAVMAALRDDHSTARLLAQQWVQGNEGRHSYEMGVASTVYAFGLKFLAEFDRAHIALRDAMYGFNSAQSNYGIGWTHVVGAMVLIQSGRYRGALAQIEAGLQRCPSAQGFGSLRTLLTAQEAFLRYERNELDRVREILSDALPLLSDQGAVDAVCAGYIAAVRSRVANADYGTALDILSEGEVLAQKREFPRLHFVLRVERALLFLRSGSASQAKAVLHGFPEDSHSKTTVQLLRVRIALSSGEGAVAKKISLELVAGLRSQQRQNRLCEALLLLAFAEDLCGDEEASMTALGEALEIGSIEGYLRTFLDEESVVMELINRWLAQSKVRARSAVSLAKRIVSPNEATTAPVVEEDVSKLLNKRERQILSLLSEGLSNAQLAQRAFMSEGTVKWYLHNLYEKFNVANRTALLRAVRDRGLRI